MSAVYDDDAQRTWLRRASGGFSTTSIPAELEVTSSSSLGQYFGSAIASGACVLYALHGGGHWGDLSNVRQFVVGESFPVRGALHGSTMGAESNWSFWASETYTADVETLPWTRRVIHSGQLKFKTAELRRAVPRTFIDDRGVEEGNG